MKSISSAILVFSGILSGAVVYSAMILSGREYGFGWIYLLISMAVTLGGLSRFDKAWKESESVPAIDTGN